MKKENHKSSRDRIVAAAGKLFFEKGYEGTSMRMIAEGAGCSTGLAYHYFPSKDQLLDVVVEEFLNSYRPRFDRILSDEAISPRLRLLTFFKSLHTVVEEFRETYGSKLHWTIDLAIRERALQLLEPYVYQILEKNLEDGMPRPPVSLNVLSAMLTHSLGSILLHQDQERYKNSQQELLIEINLMMGRPANQEIFEPGIFDE